MVGNVHCYTYRLLLLQMNTVTQFSFLYLSGVGIAGDARVVGEYTSPSC